MAVLTVETSPASPELDGIVIDVANNEQGSYLPAIDSQIGRGAAHSLTRRAASSMTGWRSDLQFGFRCRTELLEEHFCVECIFCLMLRFECFAASSAR